MGAVSLRGLRLVDAFDQRARTAVAADLEAGNPVAIHQRHDADGAAVLGRTGAIDDCWLVDDADGVAPKDTFGFAVGHRSWGDASRCRAGGAAGTSAWGRGWGRIRRSHRRDAARLVVFVDRARAVAEVANADILIDPVLVAEQLTGRLQGHIVRG